MISIDYNFQTKVFLKDNLINYNFFQRDGVFTIKDSSSSTLNIYNKNTGEIISFLPGNNLEQIPVTNLKLNNGLNAEFLNGYTAGNENNKISLKNNKLNENLVASLLFDDENNIYPLGISGIDGYNIPETNNFSGYNFELNFSGYIPINNKILQKNLNVEFLNGYSSKDFSLKEHIHTLDNILDGEIFKKIYGVKNNLITTESIADKTLNYKHQSTTNPFLYDENKKSKIFILAGETGVNGSKNVNFDRSFKNPPKVFLLNNNTSEYKSFKITDITTNGFKIIHYENTNGNNLVSSNTPFLVKWIAIGEL